MAKLTKVRLYVTTCTYAILLLEHIVRFRDGVTNVSYEQSTPSMYMIGSVVTLMQSLNRLYVFVYRSYHRYRECCTDSKNLKAVVLTFKKTLVLTLR